MHYRIFTLIALLGSSIWSSPIEERPLSNIIIVGNDRTRSEVIERELLLEHGELVNDSLLNLSKNRLENLWLFNRVEFFPMENGDSTSVLISVTERLYLFPYPEFKVEDRDWDKLTYGVGVAHDNFRGGNEKLYLSAQFGHRPGYKFAYHHPWIGREWHLTGSLFIQKYSVPNRIEDFDENHLYMAASLGKYWTRNLSTRISFYRDKIKVGSDYQNYLFSNSKQEMNNGLYLSTILDTRDLYAYPRKGFYLSLNYKKSGLFNDDLDYAIYRLDIRKYFSIQKLIIASRVKTTQSTGNLPVYDKIFLGFAERIRGHFNEVQSGDRLLSAGMALRYPLMDLRYYSMPTVLLPESSTKNMKFGINAGIFAETGIIWTRSDEFQQNNFISGYGFGVHFLLPYIEVLRVDMAFNEEFKHEFIVEIEMPF